MTRVKHSRRSEKGPKRPETPKVQPFTPRLVDILPNAGFQWVSPRGTRFVPNPMCRTIVKSTRRYIDIAHQGQVSSQLVRMFDVACVTVERGNIPDDPDKFWVIVAESVPWMKKIDGNALQSLAMKVLSARIAAVKAKDHFEEMGLQTKAEELGAKTKLTTAVDNYTRLLPAKYAFWIDLEPSLANLAERGKQRTTLPDAYLPWWVEDPDNEGSEEKTAAFKELVKTSKSMTLESEDGEDVEMGGDQIQVEGDQMDMDTGVDAGVDADSDSDNAEDEYNWDEDLDDKWWHR